MSKTFHDVDFFLKKRIITISIYLFLAFGVILIRLIWIQTYDRELLNSGAFMQQTRSRSVMPKRGFIYDRNGNVLARNENVYTIYTVNSQIQDKEKVARLFSDILGTDYNEMYKKLSKRVALEKIGNKLSYEKVLEIRKQNLSGVMIDEDYKRIYDGDNLLSHTLGFCGADNQGVIGLEAKYNKLLAGVKGKITAYTDARGTSLNGEGDIRDNPQDGDSLVLTIDKYIQSYAEQLAEDALKTCSAKRVTIIVMDPRNGEILSLVNKPDFNLNEPYTINDDLIKSMWPTLSINEKNDKLNNMWRNFAINDTYEPGSIFKIFTSTAAREENLFSLTERFYCAGMKIVEDRRIKCWRFPRAHGSQSFVDGLKNSCNPVFMELARRIGPTNFLKYAEKLKLSKKTGIDLSGEATGIFLKKSRIGPVEMAVMGFGQSFQITPVSLIRMVSVVVNGGYDIAPHFAQKSYDSEGKLKETFKFDGGERVVSEDTSLLMRNSLREVVDSGGCMAAKIEGYSIGGKTATSEKLPRRQGKYIGGFLAFAPAEKPRVIALALVDEPQGQYYGSVVALPIIKKLYESVLPYLGIEKEKDDKNMISMPDMSDMNLNDAKKILTEKGLRYEIVGDGDKVIRQEPISGEIIEINSKIILYSN